MIIASFGFSEISWAVATSGETPIATSKMFLALEMLARSTIAVNATTALVENIYGEVLVRLKTLEPTHTQRVYAVKNISALQTTKILENVLTANIARRFDKGTLRKIGLVFLAVFDIAFTDLPRRLMQTLTFLRWLCTN